MGDKVDDLSKGGDEKESEEIMMYTKDALSVVSFRTIFCDESLDSDTQYTFRPEMAHQIFGENEKIFGYRSISITLNYLHNSARCFVQVEKRGEISLPHLVPDDVIEKLTPWLPENFTESEQTFEKMKETEKHDVFYGDVIEKWVHENKDGSKVKYKITVCDVNDADFADFHAKFQTYIVWFIDAANFIDLEDDRWKIFYVYEEVEKRGSTQVTPVGFLALYTFFSYPDKVRGRVSQIFVLPPYRNKGIGSKLYETIMRYYRNFEAGKKIRDITVEEPNPKFQKIRDVVDAKTVLNYLKDADKLPKNISTIPEKMLFNLMEGQLKMCKKQRRRVLDILLLYHAKKSRSPKFYEDRVAEVKDRIRDDIKKDLKKNKKYQALENNIQLTNDLSENVCEAEATKYIEDIIPSVENLEKCISQ